ncbi:HflK protein [Desulfuribacillus stibiiarsenatis]|uniref:Protein HflK n=1 Tax=Desulfuribacillus stibiiarsenatis TaxID=1390249 RepID=A0A1E5L892_9FIRM|nr:FtsH protease activity modulator HflK [Desulfuribacillus stibiiarsenatis]OEH86278.1 HflK protein [Desulfuribacillus stibiiarsenatis]
MGNRKLISSFFGVIALVIIVISAFTCWYTVDQSEQAILITLGNPDPSIIPAGLHFKLPYPIQQVKKLSRETFSLTFGYEETRDSFIQHEKDAKMVTGDENIILADLEVQWRITDPVAYLYNTSDPQRVLYNATSASLRGVIGSSSVDDALTDGRSTIMNDIRDLLTEMVNMYNVGITIVNVNLQDVDLPNEEVSLAFRKVTDAREERNTKINQANRYRNEKVNVALGEKEAIISRAEGQKIERIEGARGDVAKFNAIHKEYANNPNITKQRLILEVLEEILPGAQIYIMEDSSSTVKYLPIDATRGGAR